MSRASERLREFHETFEVPAPSVVGAGRPGADELAARRGTLHDEEHVELLEALREVTNARPHQLMAVARELADLMVVAYGTADLFGIDLDAAFEAVMDANMAKLPTCDRCHGLGAMYGCQCESCNGTGKGKPIKRHDGKVLKPEGWQEPDMRPALRPPQTRRELRAELRKMIDERWPITGEQLRELSQRPHVTSISYEAVGREHVRLTGAYIVMDDRITGV